MATNFTTAGVVIGSNYITVRAWISFNAGTSIRDSYNVASVSDNGVGKYATPFTSAISTSSAIVTGVSDNLDGGSTHYHRVLEGYVPASTGARVDFVSATDAGTLADSVGVFLAVLGN